MRASRKIVITGGAGFIGSNYLNLIVPRYKNYLFIVIDALTPIANKKNITVLNERNVIFIKSDIRNHKKLELIFKKYRPTDVIHFAAETHVDASIISPSIFIETNVLGTGNLLLCAKKYGVNRFHHISTDEVYGSLARQEKAFTEQSPLAPRNPYSASKASAEHLVRAFRETFGLNTVTTRCSNNYGPRQDATKFIPVTINALTQGKSVPLYGKGQNRRDWIYVEDHVEAIDLVFHKGRNGEVYNIGGNAELTNIEVVNKILSLAGKDKKSISFVKDRPGHDFRYALNSSKVRKELGWKPKVSLDEGLKKTILFYRAKR